MSGVVILFSSSPFLTTTPFLPKFFIIIHFSPNTSLHHPSSSSYDHNSPTFPTSWSYPSCSNPSHNSSLLLSHFLPSSPHHSPLSTLPELLSYNPFKSFKALNHPHPAPKSTSGFSIYCLNYFRVKINSYYWHSIVKGREKKWRKQSDTYLSSNYWLQWVYRFVLAAHITCYFPHPLTELLPNIS